MKHIEFDMICKFCGDTLTFQSKIKQKGEYILYVSDGYYICPPCLIKLRKDRDRA